jgi:hypothetical protein
MPDTPTLSGILEVLCGMLSVPQRLDHSKINVAVDVGWVLGVNSEDTIRATGLSY